MKKKIRKKQIAPVKGAIFAILSIVYCFLHVVGWKRISIGIISSLPASISNIKMNFEKTENSEKFPTGPTISSPGPILLRVAAMAVKFVVKSKPFKLNSKKEPTKTTT